jgi:hypothetical protein
VKSDPLPDPIPAHPEIAEAMDAAMDQDRAYFAAHPRAAVNLRPVMPGELAIEQAMGIRLPAVGRVPADRASCWIASVDLGRAQGRFDNPDGRGIRMKFLSARPPVDARQRASLERRMKAAGLLAVELLREQGRRERLEQRRATAGKGFTARGGR